MSSTYEVGDTITLDFAVSVAGVPTDATVTLAITEPDSTVVNATPVHGATGAYSYVFTATQWGRHTYRWAATGAATAAESGVFTIGGAVSLAEMKQHLQMTSTTNDVELQRFIDAAQTAVGHRVGPLVPVTVTRKLNGGGSSLILPDYPVLSLTSAAYSSGSTITVGDLDLDTATGVVYWGYGKAGYFTAGSRNVTVVYVTGWSSPPDDLVHAVKELVRHLWETQRGNNSGRPGFTDEPVVVGSHTSWPLRVQELIEPYVMPVIA